MQTFLPVPSLGLSVELLDTKRLGKQRVEAYQILRVLQGVTTGWRNHPAVLMWKGYESALTHYMNLCIAEWIRRRRNNTMKILYTPAKFLLPPWFGDDRLHASHRSNLKRKDPVHYSRFSEPTDLPYFWPSKPGSIYSTRWNNLQTGAVIPGGELLRETQFARDPKSEELERNAVGSYVVCNSVKYQRIA